ncbi:catabolic 3-dehydroquinase [Colletotrichum truncatum]|uniref:Catabolic 3-dehydroquinase n=1 Tax=Colletotrichum truncatum TaxID=5467 RepID=A0ACC3YHT9_COLTU|nr:catabolic 3-dehydroquinase [Colletotrichum truncatum]KAF6786020.1 catabolic 3-dehydroquinase [Colletotrichum truncatum]
MTDPHALQYSHIGGTTLELLDRFAVSELCKGWPVYRDASEWANYRSLFTDDAYVWTTWSGPQPIDDFIRLSITGKEAGVFIMHRECGTLVEVNPQTNRAIGKMKATITQRFKHPEGFEYDVDCDCRFIFFCEKVTNDDGRHDWKAVFVKLVYEKDKVVLVDGQSTPLFAEEVLARFPLGYKYLGAAQASLGYDIDVGLVTGQNAASCKEMYRNMERWLAEPALCRTFRIG